jgi:hypothetical protein
LFIPKFIGIFVFFFFFFFLSLGSPDVAQVDFKL